jgi:hypothetical protein
MLLAVRKAKKSFEHAQLRPIFPYGSEDGEGFLWLAP